MALAAAVADGWVQPAVTVDEDRPSTNDDFSNRRAALLEAIEAIGRDPATFDFAAQVQTGETREDRRRALAQAEDAVDRGATYVILGVRPRLGPDGVAAVAGEVARPLREHLG